MASFGEQILAAKSAHLAVNALEDSVRAQVAEAFESWENGDLTALTVRYRLEAIVRSAYRTSAALGAVHTSRQSELPGWLPTSEIFLTPYLKSLLLDVRRNLRDYKASPRLEADRRRVVLRTQHSAGVGAQQGYTDALIASYTELEDFGYKLRKIWLANFVNNVPCEHCRALHGTEVGLREFFISENEVVKLKVYKNLVGPPRHPRCRCTLVVLVVTLENAFEELDIEKPTGPAPESMTTEDVKKMPFSIFSAVVKALKAVVNFVRKGL